MIRPPPITKRHALQAQPPNWALLRHVISAVQPGAQRLEAVGREPQGSEDAEGQEPALACPDHLAHRRRQGLRHVRRQEPEHRLDDLRRGFARAQEAGQRGEEDQEREQREEGTERDVARQLHTLVDHDQAPDRAVQNPEPFHRRTDPSLHRRIGLRRVPARRAPAEHRARSAVPAVHGRRDAGAPSVNIALAAPIAYRDRRGSCAGCSRGSRPTSPGG